MSDDQGKFIKLKTTTLKSIEQDNEIELPESDLTIQSTSAITQFKYEEPEEKERKTIIKPGCFTIEDTTFGTVLSKFEMRRYDLLDSIINTSVITDEANKFFTKLGVYKKLKRDPKRSILLCSVPGVGKTAAINKVCEQFLKEPGTCVVIWDTSAVRASSVNRFFLNKTKFSKKTSKLIMVIEDIEGGTTEEYHGHKSSESSLLNLLDGVGNPFKGVPTFIIATTNNPENSVGALIDRPGRFDKVVVMKTPNEEECIKLIEFIGKKEIDEKDREAAKIAAKEGFSIAHIQEIVVRSMIDDISTLEAAEQLKKHKEKFKKNFHDQTPLGLGFNK